MPFDTVESILQKDNPQTENIEAGSEIRTINPEQSKQTQTLLEIVNHANAENSDFEHPPDLDRQIKTLNGLPHRINQYFAEYIELSKRDNAFFQDHHIN